MDMIIIRIFHFNNEFARGKNHVNGIENFWDYAKNRLNKFNMIFTNSKFNTILLMKNMVLLMTVYFTFKGM
jgi:hypothetical protein